MPGSATRGAPLGPCYRRWAMGQRPISYGWVVVGVGALITCIGMGALFSLGVFLKPIEDSMGWSRTGISTIALINWVAMGLGSLCWGALSDRRGGRVVALVSGGIGFGVLTIAPLVRWLSSVTDWRFALIVIGDLAWLVILPAALFIR